MRSSVRVVTWRMLRWLGGCKSSIRSLKTDSFEYRGFTVAFLGPDGAGKSTIIEEVKKRIVENGNSCHAYYFAPGFLRRYRPRQGVGVTTNPHAGRQYHTFFVLAKILLMLFEFNMGMRKLRRRGGIRLFDRYIHDLLVDPKRYRMCRTRWWMRILLNFAPRPDLFVVVIAPAEVINMRKQEVPLIETRRQVDAYKSLGAQFPETLVINNTASPEAAAEIALARILGL